MAFDRDKIKNNYSTDKDNVLKDFYIPVLSEATSYDRAVGYFTTSGLLTFLRGIGGLVNNNGKMRLVIGDSLTGDEYTALKNSSDRNLIFSKLDEQWDDFLNKEQSELNKYRLDIFSWLCNRGFLEVKYAFRRKGLFHKKIGIVRNNDETVVFAGSNNETESALISNSENPDGNSEEFDVYASWKEGSFEDYGRGKIESFERVWKNKEINTITIDLPSEHYEKIKNIYINRDAPRSDVELRQSELFDELFINKESEEPFKLREHQKSALRNWKQSQYKGILALATGAGKTITAIHSLELISKEIPLVSVISVPYQVLADQWCDVLSAYNVSPIRCYRSSSGWHSELITQIDNFNLGILNKVVVVVVNATLRATKFQEQLAKIRKNNLFIITDECHHHANKSILQKLPEARFILGLSATPWSETNIESKELLQSYYGDIVARYTLDNALSDGILCKYDYYIHEVTMSDEEEDLYEGLSAQIDKLYARKMNQGLSKDENDILKFKILKRARQLDSINDKFIKLEEILINKKPSPYKLFYCGSGGSDLEVLDDEKESSKAIKSIDRITQILGNKGWKVSKFTSLESQAERNDTLEAFKNMKINAIAAIRVLDEGFDIPMCNEAYITASSRNERQFIQRRGRVLRTSEGKDKAVIHDFVILPSNTGAPFKKLIENELRRVVEFARSSNNSFELRKIIDKITERYEIDKDFVEELYVK
jgi:superfamily II DNA or RNA helicase